MTTQGVAQCGPNQLFQTAAPTGTDTQRLDTKVGAVAISNDLAGRLSVTTAEGDKITLTADLEYDFRAVNYSSKAQADTATLDVNAKYVESSLKREFGVTVEDDLNKQELNDLEKLFRKVSNIFRKFMSGQDDQALAKTAQLAERFGNLSSLSSLDLSVDVERSVTALATQISSENPEQSAAPHLPESQTPPATSSTVTQGGAHAAAAAIPQPSTGTTASTPASSAAPVQGSADGIRLSAPVQESPQTASLIQQDFDALKDTPLETHKALKYLPSFLHQFHEDLAKELQQKQDGTAQSSEPPVNQETLPITSNLLLAYQAVRHTSISLSIHS